MSRRGSAGLITVFDGHGGKTEQEVLMCVHCQFIWHPVKGSGRQRGFCMKCMDVTCGSPACAECHGTFERLRF